MAPYPGRKDMQESMMKSFDTFNHDPFRTQLTLTEVSYKLLQIHPSDDLEAMRVVGITKRAPSFVVALGTMRASSWQTRVGLQFSADH